MHATKTFRFQMLLPLMLTLSFFSSLALAADSTPAGSVRFASETPQVHRGGAAPEALKVGDRIFEKDVLVTSKNGSLGLVMRDNTTLSLGPASKLTVENFLFAPEKNSLSSIIRISRGSLACVSGEIAKLSPNSMQFIAPTSSIGIRGTHLLINVEDGTEETGGR